MTRTLKAILIVICAQLLPLQATAQERLLAEYIADIGPQDHYNSSGVRLGSFAALLGQDRANYHRFGIRHANDGWDPIFGDRAMRAQIGPALMRIEPYYQQYIANIVASEGAGGTYMVVQVYGVGNRLTRISIVVPG